MAEEVPISDVLCEAMEYLSKLGSNLRQRSDSLKEKRIRRDKLRNSHAVKKAANKVLLICQLSKKSLENVETGVKRVLDLVGAAQKSEDGGRSSSRKSSIASSSEIKPAYHYFEYDRRRLRVAKKISLGHYTSVKVIARKMPKCMQDKYPVYYDCKLYRMRKRLLKTEKLEREKASDGDEKNEEHKNRENLSSKKDKNGENQISRSESPIAIHRSTVNTESDHVNTDSEKSDNEKVKEKRKKGRKASLYISSESDTEVLSVKSTKENEGNPKSSNETETDLEGSKIFDENLSCGHVKNCTKSNITDDDDDDAIIKEKDKERRSKKTKHKRIGIIDDSDSDSIEVLQNNSISIEKEDIKSDAIECNQNSEAKDDESIETESQKPLLKLVNINKLLKPDLVKEDNSNSKQKKEPKQKSLKSSDTENTYINKEKSGKQYEVRKKCYSSDSDDAAFWEEKQKEVKAFKPKMFTINISRLPNISEKLLHKYNLKKITKNCLTVCEISQHENEDEISTSTSLKESIPDINTVKNALLQDSDSDKSDGSKKDDTEETENAEKYKNNQKHTETSDNANKSLNSVSENLVETDVRGSFKQKIIKLNSDNDSNDSTVKETKRNNNEIKSSLLNDSSSSDVDKTSSKERNAENRSAPGSDHNEKDQHSSMPVNDDQAALLQDTPEKNTEKNKNVSPDKDANEIKSALLNDSSNDSQKSPSPANNVKSTPEKNTEKDKNVSPDKDANEIKSALLNDSSNDSEKSPNTANNVKSTPQSKRKHIMESMHAKKMLLTYSSSSETEDENLKRVLKGIKDELLKGMSSGEDDDVKTKGRKKLFSSDSDQDIASRAKKKRKLTLKKNRPNKKKSSSDDDAKSNDNSQSDSNSKKSDSSTKKMGRSGDSGSSSDTQEDKIIDGLANLKNLNKPRRRVDSSDTQGTEETSGSRKSARRLKMAKTPLISGEGLLEAPISSDDEAASGAESEVNDEELPAVPVTSLNGGGLNDLQEHLAKDDLLEESDSSKSSEDNKEENSEEEENAKKKRRKANTISSDSEAGSSRRKEKDNIRLSDFEDSEDDSSEPVKKSKRKKVTDSDASGGSSNEGKKKRRRIKQIDSDDVSGSESETEGRNKHGRKNIRKVMGKSQLEEATKKAAREEKERLARIAERQKMYNNVEFDESGKPDEVVVDKVVLDFDPETKEPLIEVDRGLVKKLKPHQANGIKFMWDACFESVKRIKKDKGSGCILAHCMGLGKTLQVVSLTHTLLTHSDLTGVNRVLVVCPLSTVLNWVNEFRMWLQHAETDYDLDIYELSKFKQNSERAFQLSQWLSGGGVCVLGYEMFRNLSADNPKKFKKKLLRNLQESLVDPGPDLVVCDEGHLLKNEKTSLSQSMNRVRTRRRIVLTGTPLQNNLKEYYCMVQFVKPNLLGKYNEYLNRFVNPITNGQYTDSTEHDIRVMKRRSHVLHKMLDGAVQRRDYGVLAPFLPPKHEYVLFITLTDIQIKLYQHYLDNYSRRPLPGKSSGFLFPDFQSLQRIWTHPLVLKYNSERYEIMQQKKREREEEEDSEGSLVDFIDDDSTPDESSTAESSDDLSDVSDDSRKKSKKKKHGKKSKKDSKVTTRRGTRANPINQEEEEIKLEDVLQPKTENPTEWWIPLVTDDELEDIRNSPKLVLLFDILRQCEAIGDKLLVFSQSLYSLDLIEHFLGKVDEATQEGRIDEKLGGHVGSWSPGVDYFRLDGSTSCENRSVWCKNFNREDNPRARLFLISTRAGGLGINLVAANRVVIFDVSWNPSHDVQSIFRVYRFGQKKPCYVYRFLAMGTMEEKIYERQVTKQAISKRVIDEQQIDRHYAENDLAELYKFEPRPTEPRPIPTLPKDRLFAEMLKDHETLIYKFHEHDSLLENKEEETLTEEERKAAWEDFENEKNRPPPVPFNAWPQHNGLVGNLLAQQQQQQQLAYAALATMLRKDMPSLSDEQIRNMLPLIYGANPAMFGGYDYGLMQKLNDLYKYPQASMMNPGMMNSMMNPGSGMGGGGTSGLQYEPPWARELQQQNQMRLQQLMQQQNQMGAKYYAGGLGSRDPVAMALQQQRAREMLVGERGGAGRPRGRPPLQPRAQPPLSASDVVNLDSD